MEFLYFVKGVVCLDSLRLLKVHGEKCTFPVALCFFVCLNV